VEVGTAGAVEVATGTFVVTAAGATGVAGDECKAGTTRNWTAAQINISTITIHTSIITLRLDFCGPITFTVGTPIGLEAEGLGEILGTELLGIANISSGLKVCGVTPVPPEDCIDFISLSIVRMPISGGGGGGTLPGTDGGITPGPIGLIGDGVGIGSGVGIGGGTGIGLGAGGGGVGIETGGVGIFCCPPFGGTGKLPGGGTFTGLLFSSMLKV